MSGRGGGGGGMRGTGVTKLSQTCQPETITSLVIGFSHSLAIRKIMTKMTHIIYIAT